MQMVMILDKTQIQIVSDWSMSYAKRVKDNNKNPEYHAVSAK